MSKTAECALARWRETGGRCLLDGSCHQERRRASLKLPAEAMPGNVPDNDGGNGDGGELNISEGKSNMARPMALTTTRMAVNMSTKTCGNEVDDEHGNKDQPPTP